jgi:hypothetical protein
LDVLFLCRIDPDNHFVFNKMPFCLDGFRVHLLSPPPAVGQVYYFVVWVLQNIFTGGMAQLNNYSLP